MFRNLGLACAIAFQISACHRPVEQSSGLTIQSEVLPKPARVGPATIMLTLSDSSAKPVTGARIVIEGDMSHAGMAPSFGESKEVEPGRYRGGVSFSMAGDWVVLLHITLANGAKVERRLDVRGVAAN